MYEVSARFLETQPTLVVRGKTGTDDISDFLGRAYSEVAEHIARQDLDFAGPPFARYRILGSEPYEFEIEAGFPVSGHAVGGAEIELSSLPGGTAAMVAHVGPYDAMQPAYAAIQEWIEEQGGQPVGDPWEVYFTDPAEQPDPEEWKTEIYQPFE